MKKLKNAWMKFAHVLGIINSTIILGLIFYVFIGVYALVKKIIGVFRRKKIVTSSWEKFEHNQKDLDAAKEQF